MRAAREVRRRVFATLRTMPMHTRAFDDVADDVRAVIAGRCPASSQHLFTMDRTGQMIPRTASVYFRSSMRSRCEAVSRG